MNRTKTDKIQLVGLTAQASHGIYDFERTNKQTFIVDVTAFLDTRKASLSDRLEDTLNYGQLAEETIQILTGTSVALIETVAEMIAEQALTHEIVQSVEVTVHKPQAPIQYHFQDVSVTIYRTRQDVSGSLWQADGASGSQEADPYFAGARATGMDSPVPVGAGVGAASMGAAGAPGFAMNSMNARSAHPVPKAGVSGEPVDSGNSSKSSNSSKSRISKAANAVELNAQPASRVVLGLGGNLGRDQYENQQNLTNAVQKLIEIEGFEIRDVSPLVQTLPVLAPEQEEQGDYYNAVIIGETTLEPEELLRKTQAVEESFGRDRSQHWGPRPVDIDLVDVDHQECRTESLTLPHPLAYQRAFVLFPWSLIAPDDTLNGQPIQEWLKIAPDRDGVVNVWDNWLIEPELSASDAEYANGDYEDESAYLDELSSAAWGGVAGEPGQDDLSGGAPNGAFSGQFALNQFSAAPENSQIQPVVPKQRPRLQRDVAVRPTPAGQVSISDTNSEFYSTMDDLSDNIASGFADPMVDSSATFGGGNVRSAVQGARQGNVAGQSAGRKGQNAAVGRNRGGAIRLSSTDGQADYQQNLPPEANDYQTAGGARGAATQNSERKSIRQRGNSKKTEARSTQTGEWTGFPTAQSLENSQVKSSRVYTAPPFGSIFETQAD